MNKALSYRISVNVSLLLMAAMLSVSCSSMKGAFKKVDLTKISIGMAKEEVIAALKKDPANTVAAKQFEDGVMEVLEYHDYVSPNASSYDNFETYWLYFFNDRLVEWGKPPVDWEVYVERIYQQRHRSGGG
jgi:hypothetical protein